MFKKPILIERPEDILSMPDTDVPNELEIMDRQIQAAEDEFF
jgi:hypothetical protein